MVIAFNLTLLSICVILFLYLIEGVDVPIWKRYENGSQSGFVRNKLWIIVLVLGLLACFFGSNLSLCLLL